MKAKKGYKKQKTDSPSIGRWLKRYWEKNTCRKPKITKQYLRKLGMIE